MPKFLLFLGRRPGLAGISRPGIYRPGNTGISRAVFTGKYRLTIFDKNGKYREILGNTLKSCFIMQ